MASVISYVFLIKFESIAKICSAHRVEQKKQTSAISHLPVHISLLNK